MSRLKRPTTGTANPCKYFLTWKSNDKCFAYWDKEKQKEVKVKTPLNFVFLEHYHSVKGWHDASESGIFSNEVFSLNDDLNVRSYKGGLIASGKYSDIKDQVKNVGGVYYKSIYVMSEKSELMNITLKGAAVKAYSDFYQDCNRLMDNQFLTISGFEEGKKGSIKFTTPKFEVGEHISDDIDEKANDAAAILEAYFQPIDEEPKKVEEPEDDGLPY